MSNQRDNKAADVALARELLGHWEGDQLRDIIRRTISGLSPEQADAAIVELFREIEILDEVVMESCGYTSGWKE